MINIYVSNYKDFLKNLFSKMAELHAERERISDIDALTVVFSGA